MDLDEIFESEWFKVPINVDIKNEDNPIIWVSNKRGGEHEAI